MSIREEIEAKKPGLEELCRKVGVPGLRVQIDAELWDEVTFIGNIDLTRMNGYANRFFELEEGLLKIFHRHVDLIDEEVFLRLQSEDKAFQKTPGSVAELLYAS